MLSEEELWEQEVDNAVKGVKSRKYSGFREAARLTGLFKTTISKWYDGRPTLRKAHEANQKLAHSEEDELAHTA